MSKDNSFLWYETNNLQGVVMVEPKEGESNFSIVRKYEKMLKVKDARIKELEKQLIEDKDTLFEPKYFQAHWQFRDGHTEAKCTFSLPRKTDTNRTQMINDFVDKIEKHYPPPKDAVWLFCNEKSHHFIDPDKFTEGGD
jgi:hypothetical protein